MKTKKIHFGVYGYGDFTIHKYAARKQRYVKRQ